MSHTCHAHDCLRPVPPKMWGCKQHWYSLPKWLRDAVWREYRPGQERDKRVTARYMAVQRLAVAHTAPREEWDPYLLDALSWQKEAIENGDGDPFEGMPCA